MFSIKLLILDETKQAFFLLVKRRRWLLLSRTEVWCTLKDSKRRWGSSSANDYLGTIAHEWIREGDGKTAGEQLSAQLDGLAAVAVLRAAQTQELTAPSENVRQLRATR